MPVYEYDKDYLFADPVALVVKDEGKLIGLDLNRSLRDNHRRFTTLWQVLSWSLG